MSPKLTIEEYQQFMADEKAYRIEQTTKLQQRFIEYGYMFNLETTEDVLSIVKEFIEEQE